MMNQKNRKQCEINLKKIGIVRPPDRNTKYEKIFNVFDTQISTANDLVGNDATAREKYQNKYRKRNISNQFRATT